MPTELHDVLLPHISQLRLPGKCCAMQRSITVHRSPKHLGGVPIDQEHRRG